MDQLICASLSHTHYWYEVGILALLSVISIATRGCSEGKGSDDLDSQRESGDVSKEPHHNCCMSFVGDECASAD